MAVQEGVDDEVVVVLLVVVLVAHGLSAWERAHLCGGRVFMSGVLGFVSFHCMVGVHCGLGAFVCRQ